MKKVIPINTVDSCCKCLVTRMGRLSWENFLGRLEHGGWDSKMTSVMEIEDGDNREQET